MVKRLIVLAACLGLLAGCASIPPSVYYRIDFPVEEPAATKSELGLVLSVPEIRAPETMKRANIMYRTSERTLRFYENHYWEQVPTETVHRLLVELLRASKVFKRVTTRRLEVDEDLTLYCYLTRFEEVISAEGRSALVEVTYDLLQTSTQLIVLSSSSRAQVEAKGGSSAGLEGLAEAMSLALKKCLAKVVEDTSRAARAL
jgi:ABC-type uncharacterized transport system auxiliary subunit